jgi:ABC-type Fe3+ transport system permease subunit
MKRVQLIEWSIITIGLIFGYKFFESIFTAIVQIFYSFQTSSSDIASVFLPTFVFITIYAVSFIILIRKSSQIAAYLSRDQENDSIPIKINKKPLLQVILIGICVATVLSNIGNVVIYLFETFKNEIGRRPENFDSNSVEKYRFKTSAVQTIAAILVIYFSKDISNWFVRKNEVDELTFDSNDETQ